MALTPEQMVAMAIEADCIRVNMYWDGAMAVERLSRFAALVAAREREACAQVCEGMKSVPPKGGPEDVERGFNAGLARASRAIRSRSANVA